MSTTGVTYIGYDGEDLVTQSSFEQSKEGVITYTEKKLIPVTTTVTTPSLNDTKVVNGITVRAVSTNVVSQSGSFIEMTIIYQGSNSLTPTIQKDTSGSTGEEPIESNKYFFTSDPAGGASIVSAAGEDNVIYNDDNSFRGFSKNAKQNLFGVTSFLNPNLVYKRSFTTSATASAIDLSKVGRIVASADDFPAVTGGITWLCVGIQYSKRGFAYDITQEFRASDKNGWNKYIYGAEVAAPTVPAAPT
jgi:hypothetical protein